MEQTMNWFAEMAAMLPQLFDGMMVTVQIFVVTQSFNVFIAILSLRPFLSGIPHSSLKIT